MYDEMAMHMANFIGISLASLDNLPHSSLATKRISGFRAGSWSSWQRSRNSRVARAASREGGSQAYPDNQKCPGRARLLQAEVSALREATCRKPDERSMRLNGQHRLIVTIEETSDDKTAVIVSITDYH